MLRIYLFLIITATAVMVSSFSIVSADSSDSLPCHFQGSVTINGTKVPDGTLVTARINNVTSGTTVTRNSRYSIFIEGDPHYYLGKTVTFSVQPGYADIVADGAGKWTPNYSLKVNLTGSLSLNNISAGFKSIADKYDTVWTYDSTLKEWLLHDLQGIYGIDFTTLTQGQGYWVRTTQSCTLTYKSHIYKLIEGWNLIGWQG